jgi:hypothetical protein
MNVTEHNLTDWTLSKGDIDDLIGLVKEELKKHELDRIPQTYWGILLGKLIIMRNDA